MKKIDWTKPIGHIDGTPCFYHGKTAHGWATELNRVNHSQECELGCDWYDDYGRHWQNGFTLLDVRNVEETVDYSSLAREWQECMVKTKQLHKTLNEAGYALEAMDEHSRFTWTKVKANFEKNVSYRFVKHVEEVL